MAIDVDLSLLDRVFQPVSDRLCGWASCFGLARGGLTGVLGIQGVVLVHEASAGLHGVGLVTVAATLMQCAAVGAVRRQIARVERQVRPGRINVARITLRPFRMVWLLVAAVSACLVSGLHPGLSGLWSAAVNVLWVCTAYFMSCAVVEPLTRVQRFDVRGMAGAF